jgi:hypothetical protein
MFNTSELEIGSVESGRLGKKANRSVNGMLGDDGEYSCVFSSAPFQKFPCSAVAHPKR